MKKMKNINTRVNEDVFYEIQMIAWFLDVSRSNLVRDMIEYFQKRGKVKIGDQEYSYRHVLALAFQKMEKENLRPEDLVQKRSEADNSIQKSNEIEELARAHVKSIKTAWLDLLEQEMAAED